MALFRIFIYHCYPYQFFKKDHFIISDQNSIKKSRAILAHKKMGWYLPPGKESRLPKKKYRYEGN